MSRLKAGIAAAVLVFTVAGSAGPAVAGEITGGPNPKPTPVARPTAVAGSICSFSGQNDNPSGVGEEDDPFAAGRVQNWGDVLKQAKDINDPNFFGAGPGASELARAIQGAGPGTECRGYASAD
jgi:hypothetical protein